MLSAIYVAHSLSFAVLIVNISDNDHFQHEFIFHKLMWLLLSTHPSVVSMEFYLRIFSIPDHFSVFFQSNFLSHSIYQRCTRECFCPVFRVCVCVCGMGFDRRCFSKTVQIVLGVLKYIWAHRRIVIGQINFYTKYIYSFDGVLNRPICCLRSPRTLTRAIPFHCSIFNKYLMLLVCVCVCE